MCHIIKHDSLFFCSSFLVERLLPTSSVTTDSSGSIGDPVIDSISDVSELSSGGVGATHAFMAICTNDTITETVRGDGSSKVLDHSFCPAGDRDAGGLLRP